MNGTKVVEYRDNTPYWFKRLNDKDIKYIYFQYAYHKNPTHGCRISKRNSHDGRNFTGKIIHLIIDVAEW